MGRKPDQSSDDESSDDQTNDDQSPVMIDSKTRNISEARLRVRFPYVKVNVLSLPEESSEISKHLKYFADFNPGAKA